MPLSFVFYINTLIYSIYFIIRLIMPVKVAFLDPHKAIIQNTGLNTRNPLKTSSREKTYSKPLILMNWKSPLQ